MMLMLMLFCRLRCHWSPALLSILRALCFYTQVFVNTTMADNSISLKYIILSSCPGSLLLLWFIVMLRCCLLLLEFKFKFSLILKLAFALLLLLLLLLLLPRLVRGWWYRRCCCCSRRRLLSRCCWCS
jgi:hypothetical protein